MADHENRMRHPDHEAKRWHMSICPYCGVGCGVEIGVERGVVTEVRGMADHPVNRGELCGLGNNLVDILRTDDRLLYPHVKKNGTLVRVSWEEATTSVAGQLQRIVSTHGPDAFAMYVSASEHLEEYYVYNKFVKGCLGTNNIESSARLCWASIRMKYWARLAIRPLSWMICVRNGLFSPTPSPPLYPVTPAKAGVHYDAALSLATLYT
jgi:anaerobic selenocysteine-containing dehydrogenase